MNTKRGLICAVAIGMLAAGMAYSGSDETNAVCQRPHEGKSFGGQFMAGLEKLNLTSDQSRQVASIMKPNREALKAATTQWQEARKALKRQIQAGPFDEQSVREACKKAAAAGEEAAVLRAKIAGQIRAVLTSDQQAALDKMRTEAQSNMHKRFAKEHGTMDK
ncbi:MAG: periplasmic heavy metal sensor [Kiritimatiellia bacterium]|jgi:Spy/CpxP family protein refolding chaperone